MEDQKERVDAYNIGSMDLTFFDDQNALGYLSENEQKIYTSLKSSTRRRRWIAGRVLSKYLMLQQQLTSSPTPSQMTEVSESSLDAFSEWIYKRINIQPSDGNRGYSSVNWNGMTTAFDLSISYRDRQVYSVICKGHEVGIDVEKIADRSPTFYRGNYTSMERAFSRRLLEESDIPESWTFTLLWTLKEATIKSFNSNSISVWDFPSLNVELETTNEELWKLYSSASELTSKGFNITFSLGRQEAVATSAMTHCDGANILSIVYN